MEQQLTTTLLFCILLTISLSSNHKGRWKKDGDLGCFNQYCEDGDIKIECLGRGKVRRCTNPKNKGVRCDYKTGWKVQADVVCSSDFINACECGFQEEDYFDKATNQTIVLETAVCDCSMKDSAKVMIAMVVSFTLALTGCGYCFARWYVVKRETVRMDIEKRANESRFDTYGDYSNASGGGRYSQGAGPRTGGGSGGQGYRSGCTPIPSPNGSPVAERGGSSAQTTSQSGKSSSTLAPAAARGRAVSPRPNRGAGRGKPVSPNPAAGRGRPMQPNPTNV